MPALGAAERAGVLAPRPGATPRAGAAALGEAARGILRAGSGSSGSGSGAARHVVLQLPALAGALGDIGSPPGMLPASAAAAAAAPRDPALESAWRDLISLQAAVEAGGSGRDLSSAGEGWKARVKELLGRVQGGAGVLQSAVEEMTAHSSTAAWQEAALAGLRGALEAQ